MKRKVWVIEQLSSVTNDWITTDSIFVHESEAREHFEIVTDGDAPESMRYRVVEYVPGVLQ